jgi:acyl transferase domain-containing protein
VTGAALPGEQLDGAYWRRNVREPVLFAQAVAALAEHEAFLEIGPHPVLAVAISQGLETLEAGAGGRRPAVLASLRRGRPERATLLEALGALYAAGHPVDWAGVHPDGGRLAALPTYPFQRQRYWFEAPAESPPAVLADPAPAAAGSFPALPGPGGPAYSAPPMPSVAAAAREEPGAALQGVEQLFASQLDSFHRMVDLQLAVLRQAGPGDVRDDF